MSNTFKPDMKLSDKKMKRLERKKRKLEAFLDVAKAIEKESKSSVNATSCDDDEPLEMSSKTSPPDDASVVGSGAVKAEAQNTKDEAIQEDLLRLRADIRARQKASMQKPKLFLTLDELYGDPSQQGLMSSDQALLYIMDLQHLLLYALQGNIASYRPRWCRLLRVGKVHSVVLLVVDHLSYQDFATHRDCFPNLDQLFDIKVEMVSPYQYEMTLTEELFWVPLSHVKIKELSGNIKQAKPSTEEKIEQVKQGLDSPVFSRKMLLLNSNQLIMEGYPLPFQKCQNYVYTSDTYKEVTESSPLFAIDCEMCMTNQKRAELTRISLVNERSEVLFDTFVKPFNPITDYLTQYSGITEDILRNVTTRLQDVQNMLCKILPPDAILCGQSLNADLHAIQVIHPYVIDTSVIYNMTGNRRFKSSLRNLTARFLGRTIQDSSAGHDSVEDATATMDLVKLKLSKGLEFGDVVIAPLSNEVPETLNAIGNEDSINETPEKKTKLDPHRSQNEPDTKKSSTKKSDIKENNIVKKKTVNNETNIQSASNSKDDKNQRKTFFNKSGTSMFESFFQVLQESEKKVILVDNEETTKPYKDQYDVTVSVQDSDKAVIKESRERVKDYSFTWAQLHGHGSTSEDDDVQERMRKTDKKVKKLLKSAEDNTLFVVLLAGRNSEDMNNAACCVTIK